MSNQVQGQEKTSFEVVLETIRAAVKSPALKMSESEVSTGHSFFSGKKRFGKLLKTKRGITLEINVELPKNIEEEFGLQKISRVMAHKNHLGTMQYCYKTQDVKNIKKLITAMVTQFKKELEDQAKAQEQEQAK
jgi:predicted lipid-binding transport protein (Tim44 family)